MDGDPLEKELAAAMSSAVRRSLEGARMPCVAFSGGVDSALVGMLSAAERPDTRLCCVGLPGARDLTSAKEAAGLLGQDGSFEAIVLTRNEVSDALASVRKLIPGLNIVELSFLTPLYLLCSHARADTILTGDGADELFGGYDRYTRMAPQALGEAIADDTRNLVETGIARNHCIAKRFGCRLVTPYLDREILELSARIPAGEKVKSGERKSILRRAAALLDLPEKLCKAPKRAAQYGTGIMKLLKSSSQ